VRVQVGVLVLVAVSFLAVGCVTGAEIREEREAQTIGNEQDVPLADAVCDEFCGMLDTVADSVSACDREACEAPMEDARNLLERVADKIVNARGANLRHTHQQVAQAVRDAETYLDPARRPTHPGKEAILVNHAWSALDSAAYDLRSIAPRPSN
jgi:argininosuccinate lyase